MSKWVKKRSNNDPEEVVVAVALKGKRRRAKYVKRGDIDRIWRNTKGWSVTFYQVGFSTYEKLIDENKSSI